ncbi:C40 family peptidase [Clostridium sp. CCUG 7971]|uniref:C40 family peptidase n=1 Tax=Clostridium sp. CCUG 7971 TaxID=2811414 RepID=UPI001ABADC6E|nr:C40 family peptidase [Clostridium sp. CCUG 7971]MBO3443023.1 C40 family peptidase [Clostridium sp. CCUG 7971]
MGIKKRQFTKNVLPKVITITMLSSFIYIGQNLETSYALPKETVLSQSYTRSNTQTGKIKPCDYLNIRSGASTKHSIVGKAYTNETVNILEKGSNGWYKVKLSNGVVGWASGSYINIQNSNTTINTNTNISKVDKTIDIAKKQMGKPYKWGAGGPSAFDCSGLTSYAYKNGANVKLPRSSREQAKVGKSVSKKDLKAGDLLFFSSAGNGINHVGIYIGDSKMVHSPRPGENVKIDKINSGYYSRTYVSAKRIL